MMELHPDAAENFDRKADALLQGLKPAEPKLGPRGKFPLDVPIQATLSDENVRSVGPVKQCDRAGDEIERYYRIGDQTVAIAGEDFRKATELAEQIHRTSSFRDTVGFETVRDSVLDWVSRRAAGEELDHLSNHVIRQCQEQVQDYTILLPLHELYVEGPFQLGQVTVRPFTGKEIDDWLAESIEEHPEHEEAIRDGIEKARRRYQGRAMAEYTATADRARAVELARQHAADALSVLRFYSPAMFDVRIQSHCTLLGQERVERKYEFEVTKGKLLGPSESIDVRTSLAWQISLDDVRWMKESGLKEFEALLTDPAPSQFTDVLLESVLLHSRGSIERGLTEKLVYAVVALEALFVRNESEPIQSNVSERLAFVVGKDVPSRKRVIRTAKDAYGLRSKFLHHGQQVADVEVMNEFFHYLWHCLLLLARKRGAWKTKEEMLNALEDRKLS